MDIAAIPGLNVTKLSKDKYAVSVNNGNYGAAVINRAQLKELADTYGVPVEDKKSTVKKVLAGVVAAGAIAAGVIYRKNIGKFFKGLFNGKNVEKVKDVAADSKKAAGNLYDRAAGAVNDIFNDIKGFFFGSVKKAEHRISYGALRNKVMKENADEIVKNFENDYSVFWFKTFKERYPDAAIELMSRK